MNNQPEIPFILLEGMDLAGKSTQLRELKQKFPSWKTNHIGLSDNKTMYTVAHNIHKRRIWSTEEVGYLYVAGLTVEIDLFVWPLQPTFQDSCMLLRSLAHHTAYENKNIICKLEELAEKYPKFSKAFVFTASLQERSKRLIQRTTDSPESVNATDRMILTDPNSFMKMDKAIVMYAKKYFNAEVLDTGTITVEETTKLLQETIQKCVL